MTDRCLSFTAVVMLGAPLDPADHHQAAAQQALDDSERPLAGRTAPVTGAARGIGPHRI